MTERSGRSRTLPRPGWGSLYALVGLLLAALAIVQILVAPGAELTVLRCALVVAGFGAMVGWTRRNRAALDHIDWCDCAGARVTMRVIPSRRRERARAVVAAMPALVEEPLDAAAPLEEVVR